MTLRKKIWKKNPDATNRRARRTVQATYGVLLLVLICVLAGSTSAWAKAQGGQDQDQVPFTGFDAVYDVNVVQLDAVVEQDGVRRTGLDANDFTLLVDGEPVEITYFTEVRAGRTVGSAEGTTSGGGSPSADSATAVAESAPIAYLVLLDEVFTSPHDRKVILNELVDHLDALRPADRMAIAAHDGRNVRLVTSWTADQEILEGAVDQLLRDWRSGLIERNLRTFFASGCGAFGDVHTRQVDSLAQSAGALMTSLEPYAPQGRKALVWLSGGWSYGRPIASDCPIRRPDDGFPRAAGFGYERPTLQNFWRPRPVGWGPHAAFLNFVDMANFHDYSIYAVDAAGWTGQGLDFIDVGFATLGPSSVATTSSAGFLEAEVHYTFEQAAERTGGAAYVNSFRRRFVERVRDDSLDFYSIGFHSPFDGDGERHQIELLLKETGAVVRTRDSFVDFSAEARRDLSSWGRGLVGNADPDGFPHPGAPLVAEVQVPRKVKGGLTVPIQLEIPVEKLEHLALDGDVYELRLEVHLSMTNRAGQRTESQIVPVRVRADRPPEAGDVSRYAFEATVPKSTRHLYLAVHDLLGDEVLLADLPVEKP